MTKVELYILRGWAICSSFLMLWLIVQNFSNTSNFDVLDVERINIREPDGTLRIAISNQQRQDGGNIDGIQIHDSGTRPAGFIFFNEHGDEMGGLIFQGKSKESAGGSLTFDRWKNDQVVQLLYNDSSDFSSSGLVVYDRPNDDTMVKLLKRQHQIRKMKGDEKKRANESLRNDIKSKKIDLGQARLFAGVENGVAQFALYDPDGKIKVRLSADPEGAGKLEIFDKNGKPVEN